MIKPHEIRTHLQAIRCFVLATPKGEGRHKVDQILLALAEASCVRLRDGAWRVVGWAEAVQSYKEAQKVWWSSYGVEPHRVLRYLYDRKPAGDASHEVAEALATLQGRAISRNQEAWSLAQEVGKALGVTHPRPEGRGFHRFPWT